VDISLAWLIAGFILLITELATGTFYLLVLGVAAFAGSGVAYAGGAPLSQSIVSAVVAIAGVVWVHQYRKRTVASPMRGLDVGQPAAFESWVNKGAGHARVKYRDALWDAQISGDASGEPGEIFYVTSVDGSTLKVSKTRPA
jgi:membrane protein implicated in regulation of membrane protease activity